LAGKRKVTFRVAPAGTTFGVADPTSRKLPPSPPSATDSVAGSELLLSTVTVQLRAFGGTGPAAGGSGVALGLGLGVGLDVGVGEADNDGDTPTIWIDSTICRTSDMTASAGVGS
jgi:hypothetical protein